MSAFSEFKKSLPETKQAWLSAQDRVKSLAKEISATSEPTKRLSKEFEKAKEAAAGLKKSFEEKSRRLAELRKGLQSSGIATNDLIGSNRKLRMEAESLNRTLNEQANRLESVSRAQSRLSKAREKRDKSSASAAQASQFAHSLKETSQTILGFVNAPVRVAVNFEEAMSKVSAISQSSKKDLQDLTASARKLGSETMFSASQAAEGMFYLAQAGFKPLEIIQTMPGMLDLAKAGAVDLATTADIAAGVLTSFGLSTDKMPQVANILAKTINSSASNLTQLAETMKYAAPFASALKLNLEGVSAMLAVLAQNSIKGSMAGTTISSILGRLAAPPSDARKALDALKIRTSIKGNLRPVEDVLSELERKTLGMGTARKAKAYDMIFGKEHISGAYVLSKAASKGELGTRTKELGLNDNTVGKMAKAMGDNTKGTWDEFTSSVENLQISIGNQLIPEIRNLLQAVTPLVNKFNSFTEKNPELTKSIVMVGAGFGIAALGAGVLVTGLAGALGASALLKFSFVALSAEAGIVWAGLASLTRTVAAFGASLVLSAVTAVKSFSVTLGSLAVGAIPAVTSAFHALKVAVMTNPIGFVVGGLAIAAGLVITNWSSVKSFFLSIWEPIRPYWESFRDWALKFMSPLTELFQSFGAMGSNSTLAANVSHSFAGPSLSTKSQTPLFLQKKETVSQQPQDSLMQYSAVPKIPSSKSSSSVVTVNAPINVYAQPGMDERKIAEQIQKALDDSMRKAQAQRRGALYDNLD